MVCINEVDFIEYVAGLYTFQAWAENNYLLKQ